jgi:hypothetical protein|tara:strand:- start:306 stop:437 length:132 start_codon:yes stop_codon:yes gene_type:complete
MSVISLAEKLGRTIAEIDEITIDEYNEWVAYYKVLEERTKDGH